MSINSLPMASEEQIRAMQKIADKKMKEAGLVVPEEQKITEAQATETIQAQQSLYAETSPSLPTNAPESTEEPDAITDSSVEPEVLVQETKTSKPDAKESFRSLREKAERAERERDEALKFVQQIQSQKQSPPIQQEEPEADININDEDLVEGKHLNKIKQELYKLRQESRQRQQQTNELAVEAKLKSQYPDFDKIVSVDHLKDLSFAFPELANSIHSNPDMYSKAVAAYTAIKKLGISQEDSMSIDKERALKNVAKPRPLSSVSPQQGESPLTKANAFSQGLTDDLKAQLRKEMNDARRNH